MDGFALFPTRFGPCGIAWGPAGLRGVALPDPDENRLRARLARLAPGAAAAPAPPAAARIAAALLDGANDDLADLALDMSAVGAFERRVYDATRAVGPGRTTTYGALATALGERGLARAVGAALGRNPFPVVVPCHRVLAAGGRIGGFTAPGGLDAKRRMLAAEAAGAPLLAAMG